MFAYLFEWLGKKSFSFMNYQVRYLKGNPHTIFYMHTFTQRVHPGKALYMSMQVKKIHFHYFSTWIEHLENRIEPFSGAFSDQIVFKHCAELQLKIMKTE